MSDSAQREWRFYIDDMIGFAEKVVTYTDGLDQAGFIAHHHLPELQDRDHAHAGSPIAAPVRDSTGAGINRQGRHQ